MKNTKGFGLMEIIIIIVVTAIISSISTGVIIMNSDSEEMIINNDFYEDNNLKEFIDVYKTIKDKYYNQIDYDKMLKSAEEAMVNYLGDKYTVYLDDDKYKEIKDELTGTIDGIGVILIENTIISVIDNSPAKRNGIKENDQIISINGSDTKNKTSSEIMSMMSKNDKNSINLIIKRSGKEISFDIKTEKLDYPTSFYRIISDNIGYIYIKNFPEDLEKKVKDLLNEIEKHNIKGLIIDVRDNAGGYLNAAEGVSNIFLEKGKVIYCLQTSGSSITYRDTTDESRSYPIVVLVNSQTASAAEILAAALKESYGATLIGTKTYGKGKVQQVKDLSDGSSVKYTTAKWLTPSLKCIDNIGIVPDIITSYQISQSDNYYDSQMAKAVETLKNNF